MTQLETYIRQFATLNRSPGSVWSESTKRRAPHKPILLLAVLDLAHLVDAATQFPGPKAKTMISVTAWPCASSVIGPLMRT